MIQQAFITQWRHFAPWQFSHQVEQDLVLSRSVIEIYTDDFLKRELAFRGGTALNKLFFPDPVRYSEDIDLVRVRTGQAKPIIAGIQKRLDVWLGKPAITQTKDAIKLMYRFQSEIPPVIPMRLKIEINTRENQPVIGYIDKNYHIESRWFSKSASVKTYPLEEILVTKLRALFQRKKGRDLLDIDHALRTLSPLNIELLVSTFVRYLHRQGIRVSRAIFEENLLKKLRDKRFLDDTGSLLAQGRTFDAIAGADNVLKNIISHLPGLPWKLSS